MTIINGANFRFAALGDGFFSNYLKLGYTQKLSFIDDFANAPDDVLSLLKQDVTLREGRKELVAYSFKKANGKSELSLVRYLYGKTKKVQKIA